MYYEVGLAVSLACCAYSLNRYAGQRFERRALTTQVAVALVNEYDVVGHCAWVVSSSAFRALRAETMLDCVDEAASLLLRAANWNPWAGSLRYSHHRHRHQDLVCPNSLPVLYARAHLRTIMRLESIQSFSRA